MREKTLKINKRFDDVIFLQSYSFHFSKKKNSKR